MGSVGVDAGKSGLGADLGRGRKGVLPDPVDARDLHYTPPVDVSALPPAVDLRPALPPVYDQGALESCTANGIAAVIEYEQRRLRLADFVPSRLFIFYNERVLDGTIHDTQAGACLRNGIKTVAKLGAPPEEVWQYDPAMLTRQPPAEVYAAARLDLVTLYMRVQQQEAHLKACLHEGYPIVFIAQIYDSFPLIGQTTTGIIATPTARDTDPGGHCMVLVGYNDATRMFTIRNSWGTVWGDAGYGYMPYDYITSFTPQWCSDFWTVRGVEEKAPRPAFMHA